MRNGIPEMCCGCGNQRVSEYARSEPEIFVSELQTIEIFEGFRIQNEVKSLFQLFRFLFGEGLNSKCT